MKFLLSLSLIALSLSSFAQSRRGDSDLDARIIIGGGRSTVRISVNERRDVNLRIRMLEEAVRDLQAQVYQLQDQQEVTVTKYVCVMKTSFKGTLVGQGDTRIEAEAEVRNNCHDVKAGFCESSSVDCEKKEEIVRY